jgi:hypothetical protein
MRARTGSARADILGFVLNGFLHDVVTWSSPSLSEESRPPRSFHFGYLVPCKKKCYGCNDHKDDSSLINVHATPPGRDRIAFFLMPIFYDHLYVNDSCLGAKMAFTLNTSFKTLRNHRITSVMIAASQPHCAQFHQ